MTVSPSQPVAMADTMPSGTPIRPRHADRHDPDEERRARADEELAEHVPPELVGAEPVVRIAHVAQPCLPR